MKNILAYIGIVFLLFGCSQATNSDKNEIDGELVDATEQTETIQDNSTTSNFDLNANYTEILNQAQANYQKKLDSGIGMLPASKEYRYLTDSLMTLIYQGLLSKTSEADQESLVVEQKEWMDKREEAFNTEYKKGEEIYKETGTFPEIEEMSAYGIASDLNYERALSLYKRIEEIK